MPTTLPWLLLATVAASPDANCRVACVPAASSHSNRQSGLARARYCVPSTSADEKMIPLVNYGVKCMSMGFLMDEDVAAVWRGPMVRPPAASFSCLSLVISAGGWPCCCNAGPLLQPPRACICPPPPSLAFAPRTRISPRCNASPAGHVGPGHLHAASALVPAGRTGH